MIHHHVPPNNSVDEWCLKGFGLKLLLSTTIITIFVSILAIVHSFKETPPIEAAPIHLDYEQDTTETSMIEVSWLDSAIVHIKKYEGFRPTVYADNDGSPTIGYGHHLRKGEQFTHITEAQGDSILRADFKRYCDYVERQYSLCDNEQIAVAMFTYNVGPTKYDKSRLRRMIDSDQDVTKEWIKWRHAMIDGEKRELRRLKERREYELIIYKWTKRKLNKSSQI